MNLLLITIHEEDNQQLDLVETCNRNESNKQCQVIENDVPELVQRQQNTIYGTTRRSTRGVHQLVWMKDFVSLNINKDIQYPISSYISYDNLSLSYKAFIAASSQFTKPTTYAEAIKDPRWIEAMQDEIQALQNNNSRVITDLPEGKVAICCRWIYNFKYKSTGEIERFKESLVAKGYS